MKDVKCPYCEYDLGIDHDDGYGYEGNILHKQECDKCGNTFVYTTSIIFNYHTYKADCLNGEEHRFKKTATHPIFMTRMVCKDCGEERQLMDNEWLEFFGKTRQELMEIGNEI